MGCKNWESISKLKNQKKKKEKKEKKKGQLLKSQLQVGHPLFIMAVFTLDKSSWGLFTLDKKNTNKPNSRVFLYFKYFKNIFIILIWGSILWCR
jgi:hypothetical protein